MNTARKTIMALDTYPLIVNLILECDGKILMIYRENTKVYQNAYALPAGKVEKGESLKHNIIREAKEEVGIILHPDDVSLAVTLWAKYINESGDLLKMLGFSLRLVDMKVKLLMQNPINMVI